MITIKDTDIDYSEFSNDKFLEGYQPILTGHLDEMEEPFDQSTINEIVLWKVNRYAQLSNSTFDLLNQVTPGKLKLDTELTKKILRSLINTKGIRLPMASTILRFKNPHIYQIIDQRVYRYLNGEEIDYPKGSEEQIDLYIQYLIKLRAECDRVNIPFVHSDRIIYLADKKLNRKVKLRNYGSK